VTHPFVSIMDGSSTPGRGHVGAASKHHKADVTPQHAIPPHSVVGEQSPKLPYLDLSVDLDNLAIPLVRFPGIKRVLPDCETTCLGWSNLLQEVAPDPAPIFQQRDTIPYYIAGILKEAELVNEKIRAERVQKGQSTIGKQRSSACIDTLGPALFLDDDGDVFAREPALRALGAAALIYTSHSYGHSKGEAPQPARGGRVVLPLNRPVSPSEYGPLWDAVNHLLGGTFDEHGRSPAQCYGQHARRSYEAPYRRLVIEGAALDADALIALGHSLRPRQNKVGSSKAGSGGQRAPAEEIERVRLMGSVRPPARRRYGKRRTMRAQG
jgi:hypothetical protein